MSPIADEPWRSAVRALSGLDHQCPPGNATGGGVAPQEGPTGRWPRGPEGRDEQPVPGMRSAGDDALRPAAALEWRRWLRRRGEPPRVDQPLGGGLLHLPVVSAASWTTCLDQRSKWRPPLSTSATPVGCRGGVPRSKPGGSYLPPWPASQRTEMPCSSPARCLWAIAAACARQASPRDSRTPRRSHVSETARPRPSPPSPLRPDNSSDAAGSR